MSASSMSGDVKASTV